MNAPPCRSLPKTTALPSTTRTRVPSAQASEASRRSPIGRVTVDFGTRSPALTGVGFASDRFNLDTDWKGDPGAWVIDEDQLLPGGQTLNIHAAGPHHHLSDFYVFVMDRPDGQLQFPEVTEAPRLTRLTLAGARAHWWRDRLRKWLDFPGTGSALAVGGVDMVIEPGPHPNVRVRPTFALPAGSTSPEGMSVIALTAHPAT